MSVSLSPSQDCSFEEDQDCLDLCDNLPDSEENLAETSLVVATSKDLSLGSYLDQPYLTLEEEQMLARTYFSYEKKRLESQENPYLSKSYTPQEEEAARLAAHKLVLSHMRYVVKVARQYLSYGLPVHDLIQEGAVGLMKAVQHFDPFRGVRLVTFAVHWIKSEIHNYVIRNWRLVKIATTKAQRKLFFNFKKLRNNFQDTHLSQQDIYQEIATTLNVDIQDVQDMAQRLDSRELSLEGSSSAADHSDEKALKMIDFLPQQELSVEQKADVERSLPLREKQIQEALSMLSQREAWIVQERFFAENPKTLKELAQELMISVERVRQIEKKALSSLKEHLAELE